MTTTVRLHAFRIEVINPALVRGRVRHALFDFDGTLSLIRTGWQDVMIPMMVDELDRLGTGESGERLHEIVRDYVTRLTGKQTIHQMFELAEQVRQRGGQPREALEYKRDYLERLEVRIRHRIEELEGGRADPDRYLVPGARHFLSGLRERGIHLYLASGTDEPLVRREAQLLGIADYFDGGIHGAQDDYWTFSKRQLIESIRQENGLQGPELLGIGDGYVEIEDTKRAGGIALGVASYEPAPGPFDAWKKERLTGAGADLLVPDFLEHEVLLDYLVEGS